MENTQNTDALVWNSMINENRIVRETAEYIKSNYPTDLSIEEIKEIVVFLKEKKRCRYADFRSKAMKEELSQMLGITVGRKDSVSKGKEPKLHPFHVTQKKKDPIHVKKVLITLMIVSGVVIGGYAVANTMDNLQDQQNALNNMSAVTLQIQGNAPTKGGTIVDQCMEESGKRGPEEIQTYTLNKELLVQKIEHLCMINPELFDVYMSNIYFDVDYARLENMDEVFSKLKSDFSVSTELQGLHEKIKDCKSYLDYMLSLGIIYPGRTDYDRIVTAVNNYNALKAAQPNNPYGVYSQLSQEDKNAIIGLRDEYFKYKNKENYRNGDALEQMAITANNELGGRPNGS